MIGTLVERRTRYLVLVPVPTGRPSAAAMRRCGDAGGHHHRASTPARPAAPRADLDQGSAAVVVRRRLAARPRPAVSRPPNGVRRVNLLLVPSYPSPRGWVSTSFVADLVKYVRGLFADAAFTEANYCDYTMGNGLHCPHCPHWHHSHSVAPTTHAAPP